MEAYSQTLTPLGQAHAGAIRAIVPLPALFASVAGFRLTLLALLARQKRGVEALAEVQRLHANAGRHPSAGQPSTPADSAPIGNRASLPAVGRSIRDGLSLKARTASLHTALGPGGTCLTPGLRSPKSIGLVLYSSKHDTTTPQVHEERAAAIYDSYPRVSRSMKRWSLFVAEDPKPPSAYSAAKSSTAHA